MSAVGACPECGAPLDRGGLCPRCLLRLAGGSILPAYGRSPESITPPDVLKFRDALTAINLLSVAELEDCLAEPHGDAIAFARALVKRGKLTPYQAGAVLEGKARSLVIGKYFVLSKLGAGGMGVVFKARHRRLGRVVALKMLPPSFTAEPELVRRFRREVDVAARLSHANIVSVLDADEDRGVHFLTMEYIDGHDLNRLVRDGGVLPLAQALDCVIQAARGLESAHSLGIVHRDVKPANLMLDRAGVVRVLDLGLARVVAGFGKVDETALTQAGVSMGTVDFMAPEQAVDSRNADHRADIYSLGCALYFLLTARPPFEDATSLQRILAHQERPAPRLSATRPESAGALESAYQRMLAKRPEDRPQSMSEVVALLEACRAFPEEAQEARSGLSQFATTVLKRASLLPPEAREPPAFELEDEVSAAPPVASRTLVPLPAPGLAKRRARRPVVLGLIVLGACAVAGGGFAFLSRSKPTNTPSHNDAINIPTPSATPALPEKSRAVGGYDVKVAFSGHAPEQVRSVAVTADGRVAISGGVDCAAYFWNVDTGEEIRKLPHPPRRVVLDVAIAPDGALAVTGTHNNPADPTSVHGAFRIWDQTGLQRTRAHNPTQGNVNAVAISRDGRRALWGDSEGDLVLWNLVHFRRERLVGRHFPSIQFHCIAFFPDGHRAVTAGDGALVHIWNLDEARTESTLHGHDSPKGCVAVSHDGRRVAVGGNDNYVTLWDLPEVQPSRRLQTPRQGKLLRVAFLPDGNLACSSYETGEVVLWDTDTGALLRQSNDLAVHPSMIAALPDGRLLTADRDGCVRLWTPRDP
jgi:eukaryotic-like serine/threonine-protein kinase